MRKTIIPIIIFCLIGFNIFGQSFSTIIDTNKLWSVVIHYYPCNEETEFIKFTQDTNIANITYKKVLRTTEQNQTNWTNYGFIREDTAQRVYFKFNSTDEKLIYDFNINENDTISVFGVYNYATSDLQNIHYLVDSINYKLFGNESRKHIYLHVNYLTKSDFKIWGDYEIWIEGVGSLSGILHNNNGFTGSDNFDLLCYKENGILQYQNTFYNTCYYFYTNIQDQNKDINNVKLFPNPIIETSKLCILDQTNNDYLIEIYNYMGQLLKKQKIINNVFLINRNEYSSGLYIFRILNKKELIKVGRFEIN